MIFTKYYLFNLPKAIFNIPEEKKIKIHKRVTDSEIFFLLVLIEHLNNSEPSDMKLNI